MMGAHCSVVLHSLAWAMSCGSPGSSCRWSNIDNASIEVRTISQWSSVWQTRLR